MAVKSLAQSSILQPSAVNSLIGDQESNYFHHLETVRLSSTTASVTFSNLGRYTDYQHLQIRYTARSNRAGTDLEEMILRLNNDSGTNYSQHQIFGSAGVSVAAVGGGSSTYAQIGITSGSVNGSHFVGGTIDLLDVFETTKNKTLMGFAGWHGTDSSYRNGITLRSSAWYNTAAVTSITLLPITNSFVASCRFSLYGLKARA